MSADAHNPAKSRGRARPGVTLDFDGPLVTPEAFRDAACAFVDLIQGVSEEIGGADSKPQWDIQVKRGSRIFTACPVPDPRTLQAAEETIKAIRGGLTLLQRSAESQPPYFNQRALRAARTLSRLADTRHKRITYVKVKTTGKAHELSQTVAASVERLLDGGRETFGSVEGRLRTVSDSDGNLQFVVFDDLFNKGVNCFVSEEASADVIKAFRKRVMVQGMVKSDPQGRPLSIKVETIREFRDTRDLPTLEDLYDVFNKAG